MSAIASTKIGSVNAKPIQKRRLMSASSGFGPSSAVAALGSSAIPQSGQVPGPTCMICGCIGQVYSTCAELVGLLVDEQQEEGSANFGWRKRFGSASNFLRQCAQQK